MQEAASVLPCHALLRRTLHALARRRLREPGDRGPGAGQPFAESLDVPDILVAEDVRRLVPGDFHRVGLVHAARAEVRRRRRQSRAQGRKQLCADTALINRHAVRRSGTEENARAR